MYSLLCDDMVAGYEQLYYVLRYDGDGEKNVVLQKLE